VNATPHKETESPDLAEPSECAEDELAGGTTEDLPMELVGAMEELVGAMEEHEINMAQAKMFRDGVGKARDYYQGPGKQHDAGQRERTMKLKPAPLRSVRQFRPLER